MEELTTAEIAACIGCTERTVQRWIKSGKLPALPLANHRYGVNPSDLQHLALPEHGSRDGGDCARCHPGSQFTLDTLPIGSSTRGRQPNEESRKPWRRRGEMGENERDLLRNLRCDHIWQASSSYLSSRSFCKSGEAERASRAEGTVVRIGLVMVRLTL